MNEYGLFAGTPYEQDDEETDKIYGQVDENMDARCWTRRCVLSGQFKVSLSHSIVFHTVFYFFREAREQAELAKQSDRKSNISSQI